MSTTAIANAIKEGLALWKTYIATREQAYKRKMDRKLKLAIEYAERYILNNESDGDKNLREKYRKKFFKYN